METSVLRRIHALQQMSVDMLRREWETLYSAPSRSRNKSYLYRRLAWRIQELAHGGLSDRAKTRLEELAPETFSRARTPTLAQDASSPRERTERSTRDPRLPTPGTVIVRAYRGRELRLVVLDGGFELDGIRYGSLSEAARAVTGAHWNGRLFWNVTQRKRST